MVEAEYPPEAKAEGLTGVVVLEVDIGEDGAVMDAQVTEPAGHGFDEAALEAVRKFRFSPAEIDGQPAAVRIEYRYHFFFRPPPETPADASPDGEAAPAVVNLQGLVLERGTRKPIAGATVDVADGAIVVYTDDKGHFEAAGVPLGEVKVVVVETGHERFETTENIEAGQVTEVKYYVYRAALSPFESVITGRRERKEVSTVAISVGELQKLPGVSGDAVKVVQNLPGIARVPFGSGRLVVRGGNPNDTRTYIDGQYVPTLFHFGGITSVYASELVQQVEFEPGNFGARYGRATAGRIELVTRPASPDRLHLLADVDLYNATGLAEGPVSDDVSVAVAARRSYVDAVIAGAASAAPNTFDGIGFSIAPRFYDYQGKIDYKLDERNSVRFDVFGSSDALALTGIDTGGVEGITAVSTTTAFTRVGLTWDHRINSQTRTRVQIFPGFDHFDFDLEPITFQMDQTSLGARVEGFHVLAPNLEAGVGLDLLFTRSVLSGLLPNEPPPGQIPPPDFRQDLVPLRYDVVVSQPAIWTEAIWQPVEGLKLVPGLRLDYDSLLQSGWFDPRFAARWAVAEDTILKGGVGLYHQPPQPQFVTEELGNPAVKEEGATQYSVGVEQRLLGPLGLDLQIYYKDLFNLVIPSARVIERNGEQVPERYANEGTGRAYGAELLLRYDSDGRFFGWIAYSLARSVRDQQEAGTNLGEVTTLDQPHNFVAVGSLELPEIWRGLSFGFRMRYTTGNPRREIGGSFYDADTDDYRRYSLPFGDARFPAFFQLDLRLDKAWTYEGSVLTAYIDVQNVTNRKNAEAINYNFDFSRWAYSPGLPLFPSFGVRYAY
ncbi:TonB-dependent receptor [Vulgatibacter incomptus]|nr:TonB family protein [Vulgatibacter incomptus]